MKLFFDHLSIGSVHDTFSNVGIFQDCFLALSDGTYRVLESYFPGLSRAFNSFDHASGIWLSDTLFHRRIRGLRLSSKKRHTLPAFS